MTVRIYRMTVSSVWYDDTNHVVREYEMHMKTAREGNIRDVRFEFARKGIRYFQRQIEQLYDEYIPKNKIRVSFEREETTTNAQSFVSIYVRRMDWIGRNKSRWHAERLPTRVLRWKD